MSHDYTACKRSLECLSGLGALGKINPGTGSHQELRCLSVERKLVLKITCDTWHRVYGVVLKSDTISWIQSDQQDQMSSGNHEYRWSFDGGHSNCTESLLLSLR
ncbi:hypothetical protein TNCV_1098311 [Trichonephila clavipes]|nr:hypothetical protein TNCV_1098311 [Trichonephila clavipes]